MIVCTPNFNLKNSVTPFNALLYHFTGVVCGEAEACKLPLTPEYMSISGILRVLLSYQRLIAW